MKTKNKFNIDDTDLVVSRIETVLFYRMVIEKFNVSKTILGTSRYK